MGGRAGRFDRKTCFIVCIIFCVAILIPPPPPPLPSPFIRFLFTWLITPKQHQISAAFARYDTDHSGSLDEDEVGAALQDMDLRIRPAVLRAFIQHCDTDGNGTLDLEEFEAAVASLHLDFRTPNIKKWQLRGVLLLLFLWVTLGTM